MRGVMEHCLAGIQVIVQIMSTIFRQQGSLQQINVTVLVNFCFLPINKKEISFSIPTISNAHYQLFRETGS